MIPFVILLLCATLALGSEYMPYNDQKQSGSQDSDATYPMDYFDDIYNTDLKIKPESMFSYNFEQTRRDQPPQVEMREENVGRYFHSRPTTTTPSSIFSMNVESEAQHVYPNMSPRNGFNRNNLNRNDFRRNDFNEDSSNRNVNNEQSWNEPQQSSVAPPPRFAFTRPRSGAPREIPSSQYQNQPVAAANSQSNHRHGARHFQPHPAQIQTTTQPPMQWTENYHIPNQHMFAPTPAPYVPQYAKESEISFSPSASYVSDSISDKKQTFRRNMPRGHHKFNWNDLKTDHEEVAPIRNPLVTLPQAPSTAQPSTAHAMNDNKAPPPVPTLSPWYDGFGK